MKVAEKIHFMDKLKNKILLKETLIVNILYLFSLQR